MVKQIGIWRGWSVWESIPSGAEARLFLCGDDVRAEARTLRMSRYLAGSLRAGTPSGQPARTPALHRCYGGTAPRLLRTTVHSNAPLYMNQASAAILG